MLGIFTSAAFSGALVDRVSAQAAPTSWIGCPGSKTAQADQMARIQVISLQ